MKAIRAMMTFAIAVLSSWSLLSQDYQRVFTRDGSQYEGQWPKGRGVLYSYNEGLVLGEFVKGRPEGKCVCYKPNGEVYWGFYKKGKQTGYGRIYRDNGIVVAGGYKDGRYHGVDTLYRSNGSMMVGKYKKGKLVSQMANIESAKVPKPRYPQVDFRRKHEDFLRELELMWEERNQMIREGAGFVHPKFQGGTVEDFALWVNSQKKYPSDFRSEQEARTVIVEFTVMPDGSLAEIHAIFGSDPILNEAAVEAVRKSPKWQPAEHKGINRSVRLTVPVVF